MTIFEAMEQRHSVRAYDETRPIPAEIRTTLAVRCDEVNREGDLHLQLVFDEPEAFSGTMAHYGKFSGVKNYIAVIGKSGAHLDERAGYAGEKLVLRAQQLGLNTCWVALTFKKVPSAYTLGPKETLVAVIALGYGKTQGSAHRSKPIESISDYQSGDPDWYARGLQAALLAPTAVNQQKFSFRRADNAVRVTAPLLAPFGKVDLGIVKLHFELGAGKDTFHWDA